MIKKVVCIFIFLLMIITALSAQDSRTQVKNYIKANGLFPRMKSRENGGKGEDTPQYFASMPSATLLIQGLTGFLLDRAKEEMAQSFIKDLNDWLLKNTLYDKILIETCSVVQTIDQISYKEILSALKAAFVNDLDKIPHNLATSDFLDKLAEKYKEKLGKELELELENEILLVKMFFGIYDDIRDGKNPATAIYENIDTRINGITKKELHESLNTIRDIAFVIAENTPKTITDLDSKVLNQHGEIIRRLSNLSTLSYQYADSRGNDAASAVLLKNYLQEGAALVDEILETIYSINEAKKEFIISTKKIFTAFLNALIEENFSLAVAHLAGFLRLVKEHHTDIFSTLDKSIIDKSVKYLMFLASLCSAQTAEEVHSVLEAAADPVGSYKAKRNNPVTVSLNSYLGLGIPVWHEENTGYTAETPSLMLPLGIEFSFLILKDWISGGIFLCLFDVGKLADYSADEFSGVSFNTILTPGIGVILGVSPYPFAGGALLQYCVEEEVWRFTVFVSIDLTLFRF